MKPSQMLDNFSRKSKLHVCSMYFIPNPSSVRLASSIDAVSSTFSGCSQICSYLTVAGLIAELDPLIFVSQP